MFDQLLQMWNSLQTAAANPTQAEGMLARLGDPGAGLPQLFADASSWSPTNFGDQFQGAQLAPSAATFAGQPASLNTSTAALSDPAAASAAFPQPKSKTVGAAPDLTPEQYQQLMGMMPDQKANSQVLPPPGVARPAALGAMQMLQGSPVQPQRRMTLADLIYGGR
jgi:hypothetical protein